MHRRPVSSFARRTAAAHATTRSSYGEYGWSARPWSSLTTSIPPLANLYAISASAAVELPIGFNAVMIIGPLGTPRSFRSPRTPNFGPGYAASTDGGAIKSATITPSFMDVFPKTTLISCEISFPAVSAW